MAKGGFRGMPGGMNQAAMMKQAQKLQAQSTATKSHSEVLQVNQLKTFLHRWKWFRQLFQTTQQVSF